MCRKRGGVAKGVLVCCCLSLATLATVIGISGGGDEALVALKYYGIGAAGGFGIAAVALVGYAVCRKQRNTQSENDTQQSVPTVPPAVMAASAERSQDSLPEVSALLLSVVPE